MPKRCSRGPAWLREVLRQRLREPSYLPSHLLAYFMLAVSDDDPIVHASDVSVVLNSLQAGATQPGEIQVAITDAVDGNLAGWAAWGDMGERGAYFEVDEPGQGIPFWRRLAYCLINTPSTNIQLSADQEFRFGPEAYVEAASLEIHASEFRVDTGQADDIFGTALTAEEYSDASMVARVRVFGKNDFDIQWPHPAYPWVEYQAQRDVGPVHDPLIDDAYRHLRRILRGFRGSAWRAGIGRSIQYIDQVAVGPGQLANSVLDYMVETELLKRQGPRYVLDTERAAALGLSFADLRGAAMPHLVRSYLEEFVRQYREEES